MTDASNSSDPAPLRTGPASMGASWASSPMVPMAPYLSPSAWVRVRVVQSMKFPPKSSLCCRPMSRGAVQRERRAICGRCRRLLLPTGVRPRRHPWAVTSAAAATVPLHQRLSVVTAANGASAALPRLLSTDPSCQLSPPRTPFIRVTPGPLLPRPRHHVPLHRLSPARTPFSRVTPGPLILCPRSWLPLPRPRPRAARTHQTPPTCYTAASNSSAPAAPRT